MPGCLVNFFKLAGSETDVYNFEAWKRISSLCILSLTLHTQSI